MRTCRSESVRFNSAWMLSLRFWRLASLRCGHREMPCTRQLRLRRAMLTRSSTQASLALM